MIGDSASLNKKKDPDFIRVFLVAGAGLERCDLWVMSPTSYQLLHPASSGYCYQYSTIYSNYIFHCQGEIGDKALI